MIVLHGAQRTQSELNAAKVVELMGGVARFVALEAARAGLEKQIPSKANVIVRAATLSQAIPANGSLVDWIASLTSRVANCFVFGFQDNAADNRLLKELTGGGCSSVQAVSSGEAGISIGADRADITRQLSGLSFGATSRDGDRVFLEKASEGFSALMEIGGKPSLVVGKCGHAELMLSAIEDVADLDDSPIGRAPMAGYFTRVVPLLMFLRRAGGDRFWHNESPRACLIIDDPLLTPRYGFMEYEAMLKLMQRERFSTCIAFIPWNCRRSDRRVVELFKRFPKHFSLCVHGCDHTGAEFASHDRNFLDAQAAEGLHRMAMHRDLTAIGFDDVMVFPQGKFSTEAVGALKSSGYLAAVNSTGRPVDADGGGLQLRDLLDVAVTRFHGFPLFVRRYPQDIVGLTLDLFLGKPALLVEHHGFFSDGYAALERIVRTLNAIEPRLEWTNLSAICSQACWIRRGENGEFQVRFYTDRFHLHNDSTEPRRYALYQRHADADASVSIVVKGASAKTDRVGTELVVRVELNPGQSVEVTIQRQQAPARAAATGHSFTWRAGVFVRRHLSEFRDNHVDRNPFLSRVAARVRNSLVKSK
ncbi:MAG TPA: hypothetical protein PKA41_01010 [Verrucomicrobiota bacterium]|nr:hypothetical protein [Verrucomicrobiota bacterium]